MNSLKKLRIWVKCKESLSIINLLSGSFGHRRKLYFTKAVRIKIPRYRRISFSEYTNLSPCSYAFAIWALIFLAYWHMPSFRFKLFFLIGKELALYKTDRKLVALQCS